MPVAAGAATTGAAGPKATAIIPTDVPATAEDVSKLVGRGASLPPARSRFEIQRGQRLLAEGLFAEAAESFERVVESAPAHPGAWLLLSRARFASGQTTEALEAAVKAVKALEALPPERQEEFEAAEFHYNLGVIQAGAVQLDEAETSFRKAIALKPREGALHHRLGSLLLKLGRDKEAADVLRKATELRPELAGAWVDLGQALLRLEDATAAEKAFLEAARLAPEDPDIQFDLASAYRAKGDDAAQEAALARFEKLRGPAQERKEKAQAVDIKLRDASQLLKDQKLAEAAKILEVLAADPFVVATGYNRTRVLTDLARCRADLGDPIAARDLYEQAVHGKPDSFLARFELGTLLAKQGDVDEALPELIESTALNPFDYAAHLNLGLAYAIVGRLNDALGEVRKAATLQPDEESVRQVLVNLEWAVGHEEQAQAIAQLGGVTLPVARSATDAPGAMPTAAAGAPPKPPAGMAGASGPPATHDKRTPWAP